MKTTVLPDDFDPTAIIAPQDVIDQVEAEKAAQNVAAPQPVRAATKPKESIPDGADLPRGSSMRQTEYATKLTEEVASEETTLAESDSKYFGVHDSLPTLMAFYKFDKLSVRPFGLAQRFKIGAATKGRRVRYVVEAIAACIDRPIERLAFMDFKYLAYWLRTMSYKKTPLDVRWECEQLEHYRKVSTGSLKPETLLNQTRMVTSDIKVKPIDHKNLLPIATRLTELGVNLSPLTVADYLELVEMDDEVLDNDEFAYLADLAKFVSVTHGKRIGDRVRFLTDLTTSVNGEEVVDLLMQAKNYLEDAGVDEVITGVCACCKEENKVSLEVDLLTFFPLGI